MKNWDPVVSGPELAMLNTPRLSCVMRDSNSSLILPPQRLSPPLPVPVGSPPCVTGDQMDLRAGYIVVGLFFCWTERAMEACGEA